MNGPDTPNLAHRQAALVRALVAGAAVPAGFDPEAVHAAAKTLLNKRAREIAARYPDLAAAAGPDFTVRYIDWARNRPKNSTVADACGFARDTGVQWPPRAPRRLAGWPRWYRFGR